MVVVAGWAMLATFVRLAVFLLQNGFRSKRGLANHQHVLDFA
jgi:hypothetical protein